MAYVVGLSDKIVVRYNDSDSHNVTDHYQAMVKEQPSVFKIPLDLYKDAVLPKKLASLIHRILSQHRSQIKMKVTMHLSYLHEF